MQIEFQFFEAPSTFTNMHSYKVFFFDYWKEKNLTHIHYGQTVVSSKSSFEKTKQSISTHYTCFYPIKIKYLTFSRFIWCCVWLDFKKMNIQGTVIDKFTWIEIFYSSNTSWEDANHTSECNRLYEDKEKETVRLFFLLFLISTCDCI